MNFYQLLRNCESEIEMHLLRALYTELDPNAQKEIQAQFISGGQAAVKELAVTGLVSSATGSEILNDTEAVVPTIQKAN